MKVLIKKVGKYELYKIRYMYVFPGCQCFGDCNCKEEWNATHNPGVVNAFSVFNGRRTLEFDTLEKAEEYINISLAKDQAAKDLEDLKNK